MLAAMVLTAALAAVDAFGVPEVYPTAAGGREWSLPAQADVQDGEWFSDASAPGRATDADGSTYWHTCGDSIAEVRLNVGSPAGKAWWHNPEVTVDVRRHSRQSTPDQLSHVELLARSERHSGTNFPPNQYNGGVAAPTGTVTPPGYPYYGLAKVDAHCVGASYHANLYDGYVLFEKEVTHTSGYSGPRGKVLVPGLNLDKWSRAKFVLYDTATSVHLELWVDLFDGQGLIRVASYDDVGDWAAVGLDGCDAAPYRYYPTELLRWAGPRVIIRSDGMGFDFRNATVREIQPPQ